MLYTVTVRRVSSINEEAMVEIEAPDPEEAENLAVDLADSNLNWIVISLNPQDYEYTTEPTDA